MERIPEPELMDDPEQARAYAEADFEQPHAAFVDEFGRCFPSLEPSGLILDLGCGPGDITLRVAHAWPRCRLVGIDGAEAMLAHGRHAVSAAGLEERVSLQRRLLPDPGLPAAHFDAVISNSLLHHLNNPAVLWQTVGRCAKPGAPVFVMDLLRPESRARAAALVQAHSGNEPEILKRDFFHSLLAGYRPEEVRDQLQAAGLAHLQLRIVSDRHWTVSGRR